MCKSFLFSRYEAQQVAINTAFYRISVIIIKFNYLLAFLQLFYFKRFIRNFVFGRLKCLILFNIDKEKYPLLMIAWRGVKVRFPIGAVFFRVLFILYL